MCYHNYHACLTEFDLPTALPYVILMAEGQEVRKAIGSVFKQLKYEHLLAGISGGVLSTLVLHPLDLLKIRFQGMCN